VEEPRFLREAGTASSSSQTPLTIRGRIGVWRNEELPRPPAQIARSGFPRKHPGVTPQRVVEVRRGREPQGVGDVLERSPRVTNQLDGGQCSAPGAQRPDPSRSRLARPRRQRPATDAQSAGERAGSLLLADMLDAEHQQWELPGRHDLLNSQRNGLESARQAPAHQKAPQARRVIIRVADDDAPRSGASERHELANAVHASIGVDVNRRALPAGADCRHRGGQ